MAEVLKTLLALSLGGSLLALLLYGLKLCLGEKLSSSVYYYLWLLVLLRFVVPLPGFLPTSPVKSTEPVEITETVSEKRSHTRDYTEPSLAHAGGAEWEPPSITAAVQAAPSVESTAEPVLQPVKKLQTLPLLFALWILG